MISGLSIEINICLKKRRTTGVQDTTPNHQQTCACGTYPTVVAASKSVFLPSPSLEVQRGRSAEGEDFIPACTCFNV